MHTMGGRCLKALVVGHVLLVRCQLASHIEDRDTKDKDNNEKGYNEPQESRRVVKGRISIHRFGTVTAGIAYVCNSNETRCWDGKEY